MAVARVKLAKPAQGGGAYFSRPQTSVAVFSSGCRLLDCALGGGWAERRISNVVGDRSTGKTLLAIEAACNFLLKHKNGKVRYRESEHAFDKDYAAALGMPIKQVDFGNPLVSVEDLFNDMSHVIKHAKSPELYILDSLDALSDEAELKRGIADSSYGASKAKQMSELFRRLAGPIEESNVTVIIISQVRDKIGAMFGRKTSRSGGRALDFYASQILYLTQLSRITKTVGGIKRPIGINIKAFVDKNKIGLPFREAEFPIIFNYGIDDMDACLAWAKQTKVLPEILDGTKELAFKRALDAGDPVLVKRVHRVIEKRWAQIEDTFLPKRSKYGS